MPLVKRKGVYPYEYTDSWERLEDIRLPSKRRIYSTLTETEITESEFDHAKEVKSSLVKITYRNSADHISQTNYINWQYDFVLYLSTVYNVHCSNPII